MFVTSHQEIGRVGRVGENVTRMLRECYEETGVVEFRLYHATSKHLFSNRPHYLARAARTTRLTDFDSLLL